ATIALVLSAARDAGVTARPQRARSNRLQILVARMWGPPDKQSPYPNFDPNDTRTAYQIDPSIPTVVDISVMFWYLSLKHASSVSRPARTPGFVGNCQWLALSWEE